MDSLYSLLADTLGSLYTSTIPQQRSIMFKQGVRKGALAPCPSSGMMFLNFKPNQYFRWSLN